MTHDTSTRADGAAAGPDTSGAGLGDLDARTGWPDELKVLLERYPRDTWKACRSPMAQFWLEKHEAFRQQGRLLTAAGDEFRAGKTAPAEFAQWIAPRLQGYLGALHGHHQIEDFHYFPSFREAEPRLKAGFDALARDHEQVHGDIVGIVEAVNEFLDSLRAGDGAAQLDAQRHAGDRYAAAADTLMRRLLRHLDDEEDLIIPVMLEQGH